MKFKIKKTKLIRTIIELMELLDLGEDLASIALKNPDPEVERTVDTYFRLGEEWTTQFSKMGLCCECSIKIAKTDRGNTYGNRTPIPVLTSGAPPVILYQAMDERMEKMFGGYDEITVDARVWKTGDVQIIRRVLAEGESEFFVPEDVDEYYVDCLGEAGESMNFFKQLQLLRKEGGHHD